MFPGASFVIPAAASLIGGQLNASAQQDANSAALAHSQSQAALQKQFAQKGIRWRVKDAKAAGIHPLYALGANTPTYSPTSTAFGASTGLGDGIAQAGQNVGRALDANQNQAQRNARRLEELQLTNAQLQNDALALQIANAQARLSAGVNPPMQSVIDESGSVMPGQMSPTQLGTGALGTLGPGGIPYVDGNPALSVRTPERTVAPPGSNPYWLGANPAMANAQDVEDRYAEGISIPYGVATLMADIWAYHRRPTQRLVNSLYDYARRVETGYVPGYDMYSDPYRESGGGRY